MFTYKLWLTVDYLDNSRLMYTVTLVAKLPRLKTSTTQKTSETLDIGDADIMSSYFMILTNTEALPTVCVTQHCIAISRFFWDIRCPFALVYNLLYSGSLLISRMKYNFRYGHHHDHLASCSQKGVHTCMWMRLSHQFPILNFAPHILRCI